MFSNNIFSMKPIKIKNEKINVGVVGAGKWGKLIIKELNHIANIKFIYKSNDNYKNIKDNISWIFILTPNAHHYEMVYFFLKKKINVFCEKPLTTKYKYAKNLFNLSKKLKIKLYVDDIENFKNKDIVINQKVNNIIRTKKDIGTSKSLLYRLAYHDFYLLGDYIESKKIKTVNVSIKKKILMFNIYLKNGLIFNFFYSIKSNIKSHLINNLDFNKFRGNPIKNMLKFVLNENYDFKDNNIKSLKCIEIINLIENKLKKL